MFILTVEGRERDGAYSVKNENGEKILYLFTHEDDAVRYAMMLEESGLPESHVIEIEDGISIKTCEIQDFKYTIITPNDIVIPPDMEYDFI